MKRQYIGNYNYSSCCIVVIKEEETNQPNKENSCVTSQRINLFGIPKISNWEKSQNSQF